jgi:hypothetical protein
VRADPAAAAAAAGETRVERGARMRERTAEAAGDEKVLSAERGRDEPFRRIAVRRFVWISP